MGVLKLKKDIEKQASTRVILRSAFQIALSRFWPLKPFLKPIIFQRNQLILQNDSRFWFKGLFFGYGAQPFDS